MQVPRFRTIKSIELLLFLLITVTRSHRFYPDQPENCDHILDTRNHGSWKNFVKNGKWKRINVRGGRNGVITKSKHPNIDSVFYSRKPNSTKYNELGDRPASFNKFYEWRRQNYTGEWTSNDKFKPQSSCPVKRFKKVHLDICFDRKFNPDSTIAIDGDSAARQLFLALELYLQEKSKGFKDLGYLIKQLILNNYDTFPKVIYYRNSGEQGGRVVTEKYVDLMKAKHNETVALDIYSLTEMTSSVSRDSEYDEEVTERILNDEITVLETTLVDEYEAKTRTISEFKTPLKTDLLIIGPKFLHPLEKIIENNLKNLNLDVKTTVSDPSNYKKILNIFVDKDLPKIRNFLNKKENSRSYVYVIGQHFVHRDEHTAAYFRLINLYNQELKKVVELENRANLNFADVSGLSLNPERDLILVPDGTHWMWKGEKNQILPRDLDVSPNMVGLIDLIFSHYCLYK